MFYYDEERVVDKLSKIIYNEETRQYNVDDSIGNKVTDISIELDRRLEVCVREIYKLESDVDTLTTVIERYIDREQYLTEDPENDYRMSALREAKRRMEAIIHSLEISYNVDCSEFFNDEN